MTTRTQKFLALSLIEDLEAAKALISDMGVERIKIANQDLLHDAKGGGFKGVQGVLEHVSALHPCLGMDQCQKMAGAAYSEAIEMLRKDVREVAE
mgnify:CR=1 FL=1|jgi:fumarate hydratase class II|tara:strand:- start:1952 stop:2236 length:285 start_codon:yes stop_codon:yes gene_type:complete